MFINKWIPTPQTKSLIGALVVAIFAVIGSQASATIGYVLALSTLLMIVVAMHMNSIWPTKNKKENPFVFSIFWGLMTGTIVPFMVMVFLEGGVSAVIDVFTKQS